MNANLMSSIVTFFLLGIGVVSLIIANRCLSIKSLLIYLGLFQLAFTNVAFLNGNLEISKIGVFHFITISAVFLMLIRLAKDKADYPVKRDKKKNHFSSRVFYLVFSLLLLIGIPGTSSFISEFYLLSTLLDDNIIFVLMYMGQIVLLAIVVMHSIQLYAFGKKGSALLLQSTSRAEHVFFIAVILLNIICGIHPQLILSNL